MDLINKIRNDNMYGEILTMFTMILNSWRVV